MQFNATVMQLAHALCGGEDCSFALHDALQESGQTELATHFAKDWHNDVCARLTLSLILGEMWWLQETNPLIMFAQNSGGEKAAGGKSPPDYSFHDRSGDIPESMRTYFAAQESKLTPAEAATLEVKYLAEKYKAAMVATPHDFHESLKFYDKALEQLHTIFGNKVYELHQNDAGYSSIAKCRFVLLHNDRENALRQLCRIMRHSEDKLCWGGWVVPLILRGSLRMRNGQTRPVKRRFRMDLDSLRMLFRLGEETTFIRLRAAIDGLQRDDATDRGDYDSNNEDA